MDFIKAQEAADKWNISEHLFPSLTVIKGSRNLSEGK